MPTKPYVEANDWLKKIQDHQGDDRWLTNQEDILFSVIREGLEHPPAFPAAVELLMLVARHFALVRYHMQRWLPLLFNALTVAQHLKDDELQIRLFSQMGSIFFTSNKTAAAQDAFQFALARAEDGHFKEMSLVAYIGLIRMLYTNTGESPEPDVVDKALVLNDEVDDMRLKAGLHEALALAYSRAKESSPLAIGHGQMAYVYWHRLRNELQMALSAYLLTASYRFIGDFDHAESWLQRTAAHFANTDYERQHTLLAYERGVIQMGRGDNQAAEQWFQLALSEAAQIDAKDYTASAYHVLGLLYTGLGRYDEAEQNLLQAIGLWQIVKDAYELANAHEAMGDLEKRRQDYDSARSWLQTALLLCAQIPQENQRTHRESEIRDLLNQLP